MRVALLFSSLALVACGPDQLEAFEPASQLRSELSMASAGGCSTSIAAGLSAQLVEELNCVQPNLMANFSGSHVTLYASVLPWLAPDAAKDLKDATSARGATLPISSAYRTLGQQYLLYKWWRAGQCGIQVAAVPGTSNHQSGRAIDTPSYSTWRSSLAAQGWQWLGSSDLVHFDHLASPNVASKSILAFQKLWNRNHSTGKLAEDGDWGPKTEAAMAASPTTGFAVHGCPTTGKLSGTVTNRSTGAALTGVTVTGGGSTATTSSTGAFELVLPAGTFTVTATKSGFGSTSVSRTVVLGSSVSASMSLSPVVTTGTLAGTVVEKGAPGRPIAGASVVVGGQTLTSDATGAFSVMLPAGTASLRVSKAGFLSVTTTAAIVAGVTKTLTVELEPSVANQPPELTLSSPEPMAALEVAHVELSGTVSDDASAIATVRVVHGQTSKDVPVTNGTFGTPLQLLPGRNVVTVTATDAQGLQTTATWEGRFRAGLFGRVHRFDDAAAIVSGASLTLTAVGSNEVLGHASSDDEGRFELDALASGPAVLEVVADGYTLRELLLAVSADERTEVDVGLTPGTSETPAIRFIEPKGEGPFDVDTITISGAVSGLEVSSVTVNGEAAMLFGNGFVVKLPLPEGETTFEAIAEDADSRSVRASVTARRTPTLATNDLVPKKTGCAALPGAPFVVLLVALWRRHRAAR